MKKLLNAGSSLAILLLCLLLQPTGVQAQQDGDTTLQILKKDMLQTVPDPLLTLPKSRSAITSSSVAGPVLYRTPVANILNTLYGRLPGLFVEQGSGEPGYDNPGLSIRGRGTYDNSSLTLVVDGFQTNFSFFSFISPAEIESISVLKDPVSLATYGMKGANGVLWVVTKRGTATKPTVQAQLVTGWQSPISDIYKPYGSYNYARLYNQAISNDNYAVNGYQFNYTPTYSNAQLDAYQNGTGVNVDWYDQTLKNASQYTNTNLIFSGGDPNTKYALVFDYMNQGGLYNTTNTDRTSNANIKRYNLRSNLDFRFFKIFEAKVDLGGRIEDRRYPNLNGGTIWNNLAAYPSNIYPVKDANGNWSGTTLFPNNPVATLNAIGWSSTHDRTLQANFTLKENLDFITQGLYLQQAVSFTTWARTATSKSATYARFFNGVKTTTDVSTDIISNAVTPSNQYDWKQTNLTAGYNRSFGKHAFAAAINYYGSNYVTDNSLPLAGGQNRSNNIFYHFNNFSGRINYTYNDRYILDLASGYSGSDNYAAGNRWGFYPAAALGWVASNESFLKNNIVVSYLKLRASAGQSAYDQSNQGRYLFQQYYTGTGGYNVGNNSLTGLSGIVPGYAANPEIFAEKSTKYNVGFDIRLFNKLSLSAEVFQDNRSGIVTLDNTLTALYGAGLPYANIGEVKNSGFELSASYDQNIGDVQVMVGGFVTYAKNRILEQAEVPPVNAFSKTTGLPIGTPMGLVADGFYNITDFTNGTLRSGLPVPAFGAVQPGDIKYRDLDGNGIVNQNDMTRIGNPRYPNLTYAANLGVNWKGFELTALLQGSSGRSINLLSSAYTQTVAFVNNGNVYPIAGNAWAYYPSQGIDTRATATYPRLTTKANDNNYLSSTFWMKNGDFVRIRNIELAYNLSSRLLVKSRLQKLRLYVSAVNPFSWSSFQKNYQMDPETVSGYPALKSFNTGIILIF